VTVHALVTARRIYQVLRTTYLIKVTQFSTLKNNGYARLEVVFTKCFFIYFS
jgi:hypothetical protein